MDRYTRLKTIGEGAYGKALLVQCKASKQKYVIKSVDMRKMNSKERDEAEKECSVLKEMQHPNIISFKESFSADSHLYIVMDYADGGDLYGKLQKQHGRLLPESQIMDWFVQLCLALKHVHDRKILHRDLKSQNVFLTSNGMVKLGDFGIAKVLRNTKEFARTQIGTPYYLSPEICNGQRYNNKSDVWSLGILLFEMCALKQPFSGRSLQQLVMAISRAKVPPIPRKYSDDLAALVKQLLSPAAARRPAVNKILEIKIVRNRISKFLNGTLLQDEFSHTVLHSNPSQNRPVRGVALPKDSASSASSKDKPGRAASSGDSHPALKVKSGGSSGGGTPQPVVVKGICGICDLEVTATDERTKDDAGVYYHITCIKAEPNPQKFLSRGKPSTAPAAAAPASKRAIADRRPTVASVPPSVASAASSDPVHRAPSGGDSAYERGVAARHADFIARRQARLAYKARGQARSPISPEDPDDTANPPKPPRTASGSGPSRNASREGTREAQIREFKERQRQAAENRARLEEERRLAAAPAHPTASDRDSAPSSGGGGGIRRQSGPDPADAAEEARKAAVREYNERAQRAKENRLRAEQDERGDGPSPTVPRDDRPIGVAPASVAAAPPKKPASSGGGRKKWQKAEAPGRKKWQNNRAPVVSVAQAILDSTYCVGASNPILPPIGGGSDEGATGAKSGAKAAAIQRRRELREMIDKSRKALKNKDGTPADGLEEVGAPTETPTSDTHSATGETSDEAESPTPLPLDDVLGKSISRMLDDQVMIVAGDPLEEPPSQEGGGDLVGAGSPEPTEETEETEKVDADYEGMLMHMSMVLSADALTAEDTAEGTEAAAAPTAEGDAEAEAEPEGDDSDTFCEEGDDELSCESIFSKMERVRAELERDLGFDKFLEAYKILRGLYLEAEDVATVEVPDHVRDGITGMMGDKGGPDSYEALLGLVKAENGIH